jgi:hypothetical protein
VHHDARRGGDDERGEPPGWRRPQRPADEKRREDDAERAEGDADALDLYGRRSRTVCRPATIR